MATWCEELLFGGARYGGKTDYLLGDYLQDVAKYGKNWQGLLLRRTLTEFADIVRRSNDIYPATGAVWFKQPKEWRWPNGACLRMAYLEKFEDFQQYQGHSYPWIGVDEIGNWPDLSGYHLLKSINRWGGCPIPTKRIRATANPGGPGHSAVKSYFIEWAPGGGEVFVDPATEMKRMFLKSLPTDNQIGLINDPDYVKRLKGVGSATLVKAWLEGDWDIISGAYFTELGQRNALKPFRIPDHWLRFTSYDHGFSSPFSHGWWAISSGDDDNGAPQMALNGLGELVRVQRGAMVRYREWYGANEKREGLRILPTQIAAEILRREAGERIGYRVADTSIFDQDRGPSDAERFANAGVVFQPANKKRLAGWGECRQRFAGAESGPGLYVFDTCADWWRTVPTMQHDKKHAEDMDTEGEDHTSDETRYGVMSRPYPKNAPAPNVPNEITPRKPTAKDLLPIFGKTKNSGRI